MWVRADWVSLFSVSMAGRSSTFLFNMAASSASKKVFELFVSKVPWSLANKELKEYFSQFGTVKKCLLPFDRETGFHRGYCWIKFASEEGLQNALQKESHIIEGSKIQMQINRKPQGMYTNNRSGNDLG